MIYKDNVVVQAYINVDTYDQLLNLATKDKRKLSSYIRIILEDFVSSKTKQEASNENIQRSN